MRNTERGTKQYEKLVCSGPQVEFVAVEMTERMGTKFSDEETKKEKLERRREEKLRFNAGFEVPESYRTAPSIARTRTEIRRVINANAWQYFDKNGNVIVPKFLTLTFKENIQDLKIAHAELKKFIRRFNNAFDDVLVGSIKYLCVPEFQERGAVHYHLVLFNLPFLEMEKFLRIRELWSDRFQLKGIAKTHDAQKIIGYVSKYISKQDMDGRFWGQKRYFCSRELQKSIILRDVDMISKIRDLLLPYSKNVVTEPPDFAESFYYELYYLGEGKTIYSLPLDNDARLALELAAKGKGKSDDLPIP